MKKPKYILYIPKDQNVVNCVCVNTSTGSAQRIEFSEINLVRETAKTTDIEYEEVYIGNNELIPGVIDETPEYVYYVEIIKKRKSTPTPKGFNSEEELYEMVYDGFYTTKHLELEKNPDEPKPCEEKLKILVEQHKEDTKPQFEDDFGEKIIEPGQPELEPELER